MGWQGAWHIVSFNLLLAPISNRKRSVTKGKELLRALQQTNSGSPCNLELLNSWDVRADRDLRNDGVLTPPPLVPKWGNRASEGGSILPPVSWGVASEDESLGIVELT